MAHWFGGLGFDPVLQIVLTLSCQASLLAIIVLASQTLVGRWLSPRLRYALWSVVVIRLVMPIAPGSTWSIFNLFSRDPAPTVIVAPPPPMPTTGVVTYSLSAPEPSVTAPVHVSAWGMDDIALAVWLVGMGIVLSVIVAINIALALRLRRRPALTDPGLLELLESCKQEMGVRRSVLLYGDPKITSPALAGIFRPSLLIPPEILADLPREELRFIFLHELAHVKKHDIIQNWLLIALAAIHWFNPIIWFAFARLRADRELARDAMVLRATGTDANQAYGQTIIHTLERIARPNLQNPALAGIGDGMGQLNRRMRMISLAPKRRPALTFIGISLFATLAVIGLTDAAEPEAPSKTEQVTEVATSEETGSDGEANQSPRQYRVEFDLIPLEDAIGQVRDQIEVPLFVNWKALEAAGIERTEPIKMTVIAPTRDMLVLTILRAVSDQEGLYAPAVEMIDGILTASTVRDLSVTIDTRVYDIRHLLLTSNEGRPLAPRADGTIPERPEKTTNTREQRVGQIADLIRETVGFYEEWEAHGGDRSSIEELNGNLIVKTTPENQAKIPATLAMLGDNRSAQIRFDSRILVAPKQVLIDSGIDAGFKKTPGGGRVSFIDDLETHTIIQAMHRTPLAMTLAAPSVLQNDGQEASVAVEQQLSCITDYKAVGNAIRTDVDYEPVIETIAEGVNIKVLGTVSADRRSIDAVLHPTITNVELPIEKRRWESSPAGKELLIDVPRPSVAETRLELTIPDKATVLIDVGKISGPMSSGDPVEEGVERHVYMLVKPTIILESADTKQPED